MSVWLCLPSARPVPEVNARMVKWRAMGYKIALWRDWSMDGDPICDFLNVDATYPGYAAAVNHLAKLVLEMDKSCDWVVCAGDDTFPDPNKRADEIAAELSTKFYEMIECCYPPDRPRAAMESSLVNAGGSGKQAGSWRAWATFGVMQPTGDPWADGMGRIIERIAGSPWLGREWCRRANAGRGPLWPEYRHMFVDQDLQDYAKHLGVFLQRPDLTHHHAHAQRDGRSKPAAHMTEWNSQAHWRESKAIYDAMVAGRFKGREPLV